MSNHRVLTLIVALIIGSGAVACSRGTAGGSAPPNPADNSLGTAPTATAGSGSGLGTGAGSGGGTGSGSGAGSSGGSGTGTGSGSGSGSGSGAGSSPVVTIKLAPVADVNTPNCPFSLTVHATVSVNKGPVKVTARPTMSNVDQALPDQVLDFTGTGPQSKDVTVTATVLGIATRATVSMILVGHPFVASPNEVSYNLNCGGKPSRLTPSQNHKPCPYAAEFAGTITVPIAQTVTYDWGVSHIGTVPGGTITFTQPGSVDVYLPNVTINTSKVTNSFVVTLHVTSPGGGVSGGEAMCSSIKT